MSSPDVSRPQPASRTASPSACCGRTTSQPASRAAGTPTSRVAGGRRLTQRWRPARGGSLLAASVTCGGSPGVSRWQTDGVSRSVADGSRWRPARGQHLGGGQTTSHVEVVGGRRLAQRRRPARGGEGTTPTSLVEDQCCSAIPLLHHSLVKWRMKRSISLNASFTPVPRICFVGMKRSPAFFM